MDWDDFRYLRAVAATGSVRGAGQVLRVHASTVARRLDQLEKRIGVRLVTRAGHGMTLTPAAAGIMARLHRVAAELDGVERELQQVGAQTTSIRIGLPRDLARRLVIPHLEGLYARHPDLEVALHPASALRQLQEGCVDAALWITEDPPQDLVGRRLGTVWACAYAAPGCLERFADEAAPSACWIGPDVPGCLSAAVRARDFPTLRHRMRVEDADLEAAALVAGLGIGLLPCYLGDALDGLVRAGEPVRAGEAWLFSLPDSRGNAQMQALSAFLQEVFAAHRSALEGGRPAEPTQDIRRSP